MASSTKLLGQSFLALCILCLGLLFYYLWNHDYVPARNRMAGRAGSNSAAQPAERTAPVQSHEPAALALELQLPASKVSFAAFEKQNLEATIVLKNNGRYALEVLDAPPAKGLFALALYRIEPEGRELVTLKERMGSHNLPDFMGMPRAVTLLPGRKLHIPLSLSRRFIFAEPGIYELQLDYRPQAYIEQEGLDAKALNVVTQAVKIEPVRFELSTSE